jgi:ADP-ribosylglycohydrolase
VDDERRSRIRGSLLGGAIGDALGAPVEFLTLDRIRKQHGPAGVTGFLPAYGRPGGAITDDTQMTLFTAEGLLRALVRDTHYGVVDVVGVVQRAYWRWLATQGESWPDGTPSGPMLSGWLFEVEGLHARRAPGNTCLDALRSGRSGTVAQPLNNSKGCGAVMRSAPFGLIGQRSERAFDLGMRCGVLTHGHPSGYLSAGALASIVASLAEGGTLDDALDVAVAQLRDHPGHAETLMAIEEARRLAALREPSPEQIERLGGGWVGHEALAIAVYCSLVVDDPVEAILLAVNHSGDTDSTGSIAGNIVGAARGEGWIPGHLLADLELVDVIRRMADDLAAGFFEGAAGSEHGPMTPEIEAFISRYPGA